VQTLYPGLFQRIKQSVASGRFIPVGGSWVEMDGYLPSGESMCRQMLFGQKYFIENFGIQCTEVTGPFHLIFIIHKTLSKMREKTLLIQL